MEGTKIDLKAIKENWLTWDQVQEQPEFREADTEGKEEILDNWVSLSNLVAPTLEGYDPEQWSQDISSLADTERRKIQDSKGFGEKTKEFLGELGTNVAGMVGAGAVTVLDTGISAVGKGLSYAQAAGKALQTGNPLDFAVGVAAEEMFPRAGGYTSARNIVAGQGPGEKKPWAVVKTFANGLKKTQQALETEILTPEAYAELDSIYQTEASQPRVGGSVTFAEDAVAKRRAEMMTDGSPYRRDTPMRLAQEELRRFIADPKNAKLSADQWEAGIAERETKLLAEAQRFWGDAEGTDGTPFTEQPGRKVLDDPTNEKLVQRFLMTRNPMYLDVMMHQMSRSAQDVETDRVTAELNEGLSPIEQTMMQFAGDPVEVVLGAIEIGTGMALLGQGRRAMRLAKAGRTAAALGVAAETAAGVGANVWWEGQQERVSQLVEDPTSTKEQLDAASRAGQGMALGMIGIGTAVGAAGQGLAAALRPKGPAAEDAELVDSPTPSTPGAAPVPMTDETVAARPDPAAIARQVKAGLAGQQLDPVTELLGETRAQEIGAMTQDNFATAWAQGGITAEEKRGLKRSLGLSAQARIPKVYEEMQRRKVAPAAADPASLRQETPGEPVPRQTKPQVGTVGGRLQEIASRAEGPESELARYVYDALDEDTKRVPHAYDDALLDRLGGARATGVYLPGERRVAERATASDRTGIHEAIHAKLDPMLPRLATTGQAYLDELRTWAAAPERRGTALADLVDVYAQAITTLHPDRIGRLNTVAAQSAGGISYSVLEYVPELMSNPDLVRQLDAVPYQAAGKKRPITLLRALVDAIRRAMGMAPRAGSLLEASLKTADTLLRTRPDGAGNAGPGSASFSVDAGAQNAAESTQWKDAQRYPRFLAQRRTEPSPTASGSPGGSKTQIGKQDIPSSPTDPSTPSPETRSTERLSLGSFRDLLWLRSGRAGAVDPAIREIGQRRRNRGSVVAEVARELRQLPASAIPTKHAARAASDAAILEGYFLSDGERIDAVRIDQYVDDQPATVPPEGPGLDRLAAIEQAVLTWLEFVPASAIGRKVQFAYVPGDRAPKVADRIIRNDPDKIVVEVPAEKPTADYILGAMVHALREDRRAPIYQAIRTRLSEGVVTHVAYPDATGNTMTLVPVAELAGRPDRFGPEAGTRGDDAVLIVKQSNGVSTMVPMAGLTKVRAIARASAAMPNTPFGELEQAPEVTEAMLRPAIEREFRNWFEAPTLQSSHRPEVHEAITVALAPTPAETARGAALLAEDILEWEPILRTHWEEAPVPDDQVATPSQVPALVEDVKRRVVRLTAEDPRTFDELSQVFRLLSERLFDVKGQWLNRFGATFGFGSATTFRPLEEANLDVARMHPWLTRLRRILTVNQREEYRSWQHDYSGLEAQIHRNATVPAVQEFLTAADRYAAAGDQIMKTDRQLQALRQTSRERLIQAWRELEEIAPTLDTWGLISARFRLLAADVAVERMLSRAREMNVMAAQKVAQLIEARESRVRRRTKRPGHLRTPFERFPRLHLKEVIWYYTSPVLHTELKSFGELMDAGSAELAQVAETTRQVAAASTDWLWLSTRGDLEAIAGQGVDVEGAAYLQSRGIESEEDLDEAQIRSIVARGWMSRMEGQLQRSIEELERTATGTRVHLAAAQQAAAHLRAGRLDEAGRVLSRAWTQRAEMVGDVVQAAAIRESVAAAEAAEASAWFRYAFKDAWRPASEGEAVQVDKRMDLAEAMERFVNKPVGATRANWLRVRRAAQDLNQLEPLTGAELFRAQEKMARTLGAIQEVQRPSFSMAPESQERVVAPDGKSSIPPRSIPMPDRGAVIWRAEEQTMIEVAPGVMQPGDTWVLSAQDGRTIGELDIAYESGRYREGYAAMVQSRRQDPQDTRKAIRRTIAFWVRMRGMENASPAEIKQWLESDAAALKEIADRLVQRVPTLGDLQAMMDAEETLAQAYYGPEQLDASYSMEPTFRLATTDAPPHAEFGAVLPVQIDPVEPPEGMAAVSPIHLTLTSGKLLDDDIRARINGTDWSDLQAPDLHLGPPVIAKRPASGKESYVAAVLNQSEARAYVDEVYRRLGMANPEPSRFFHVTLANNAGGNPFKSIGDVTQADFAPDPGSAGDPSMSQSRQRENIGEDLTDAQVGGLYAAVEDWVQNGGKLHGARATAADARRMLAQVPDGLMVQVLGLDDGRQVTKAEADAQLEALVPMAREVIQFYAEAERNGSDPSVIAATYQEQHRIRTRIQAAAASNLSAAVTAGRPVSLAQVRDHLLRAFEVPLRYGIRANGLRALGIFKAFPEIIRLRHTQDIETFAHELGHFLHFTVFGRRTDAQGRPVATDFGGQFDAELLPLGQVTSLPAYTQRQIRNEGVAEWLAYFLADPAQARARAPKFTAHVEQFMEANEPRLLHALRQAQEMVTAYIRQPDAARLAAQIDFNDGPVQRAGAREWLEGVRNWWRTHYTRLFNNLYPIERVTRQLIEMGLPAQQAQRFAELAINHQGGVNSKAEADIHFGQRNLEGQVIGRSLQSILAGLSAHQQRELSMYMVRKRADELEGRGIRTGVPPVAAPEMQRWATLYEARRQDLLTYQRNLLQLLVDSGVISAADYGRMVQANQDYVPFYRIFEEIHGVKLGGPAAGNGFVNLRNGIRQIRGSDRQIIDPLESIIKNTYLFRTLAERNRVGRTFVDSVQSLRGHGVIMDHVATKMAPVRVSHEAVAEQLVRAGVVADRSQLTGTNLEFNLFRAMQPDRGQGEFTVWRNGRQETYQVHDPLLFESLTFADVGTASAAKMFGLFWPLIRGAAKTLRIGATYTPGFTLANWFRDQFVSGVQSKSGFIPFYDGLRGAWHVATRSAEYQEWVASGGKFAGQVTSTRDSLREVLEELAPAERATALSLIDPRNILRGYVAMMDALNEISEESTRVAEFMRAQARGLTGMQAANRAKDVSINFARGGAVSRALNAMIPFFNVGMQDADKVFRTFADPQAARTEEGRRELAAAYMRGIMMVTTPSIMVWWLGKDDDEIQNLSEWRRNYFWNINLRSFLEARFPGQPHYIVSVPKPFLAGAIFGTLVERGLDQWHGRDPKGVMKGLSNIWGQSIFHGDLIQLPAVANTLVEMGLNRSFFTGGPIVPERLSGLPPHMQFTNTTSEVSKAVSGQAAAMGHEISPMMIDHLVRGYFASLGSLSLTGIDALGHGIGYWDKPAAAGELTRQLVGISRFRPKDLENTRYVDLMFRGIKEAEQVMAPLSTARMMELPGPLIQKHVQQHGREIAALRSVVDPRTGRTLMGELNAAVNTYGELTKAMRLVEVQTGLPQQEREKILYDLNVQRNRIAEQAFRRLPPSIQAKLQ